MREADRSSLPQGIQEQRKQEDEATEMGRALRKECVDILSGHGVLSKRHFLTAVIAKLPPVGITDIKFSELLAYRHVRRMVSISNGKSLEVEVASLGNSPPGEARWVNIYVPEISKLGLDSVFSYLSLMIDRDGVPALLTNLSGHFSLNKPVEPYRVERFSQAVNLLGNHLKNTHPSA